MARKTETYTREVEREKEYYVCDRPFCTYQFHSIREANIILANPQPEGAKSEVWTNASTGDKITQHSNTAYGVDVDGELHLCDSCYQDFLPVFIDEEEEEEEDKVAESERQTVFTRLKNIFG